MIGGADSAALMEVVAENIVMDMGLKPTGKIERRAEYGRVLGEITSHQKAGTRHGSNAEAARFGDVLLYAARGVAVPEALGEADASALEHFTLTCSHLVRGCLRIMRALSLDLRERVLAACEQGGSTRQQVAERFRVSLGMVKKLLAQRRHALLPNSRAPRRGRPPKVRLVHQRRLRALVRRQPDLTLEQLRAASGLACSLVAIHRALVKLGLTYKKRRSGPASRTVPTWPALGGPGGSANAPAASMSRA